RLPGVIFFCISDTLVPTTYLVDTTLSNSSDSDQTVQADMTFRVKPESLILTIFFLGLIP
ncbi:hypothetical protein ACP6DV_28195, partial [Klebsiella pneumoniae subsp. pneumoniae]|uniref:hypothetical protein n=1 Tax=Klebsiella pneumoniae TaxID=573 RepID=UPI003CF6CEE5